MQRRFWIAMFLFGLTTIIADVACATSADTSSASKDAYMEASISPKSPYVKAETIYILKLFYRRAIQQPSFTEPKAAESVIFLLGREKTYQKIVDGEPYQVLEQRYAIVPNKSGIVQIKGPTLTGKMNTSNSDRRYNYYRSQWQDFKIAANDVTMNVKPVLPNITPWIPAREFKLNSQWSTTEDKIKVGEPVTLTVSMYSNGVMGEQLPDLSHWDLPGIQTYSDKADIITTSDATNLLGQRIEKIAFLPQAPGKMTIPAKHIRWLNTTTGHLETATIPGKTFTVTGVITPPKNDSPMTTVTPITVTPPWYRNLWIWLTSVLTLVWLCTIAYYQKRLQLQQPPSETAQLLKSQQTHAWQSVKKACQANTPRTAANALLKAAKHEWPDKKINNLRDLAAILDDEIFREQLTILEKLLYKDSSVKWQGKSFLDALSRARTALAKNDKASSKTEHVLQTLYPE